MRSGAEPITSSYGTIGHISTDELLARRRQRQQAERMAHLASQGRSSFARKPMASLQPHVNQSKPASTGKEAAANCLAAPATVNPLSRAAKRPLEKTSHSVAAPQETVGVSTEDLVKLLGDHVDDAELDAKRLKLSDVAPAPTAQPSEESSPLVPVRACLTTLKSLDPALTLAAAAQRVAEQRKQQQLTADSAAKESAEAETARAAAAAVAKALAAAEASALAGKRAQQAAEQLGQERWRHKKLKTLYAQQQQEQLQGAAASSEDPTRNNVGRANRHAHAAAAAAPGAARSAACRSKQPAGRGVKKTAPASHGSSTDSEPLPCRKPRTAAAAVVERGSPQPSAGQRGVSSRLRQSSRHALAAKVRDAAPLSAHNPLHQLSAIILDAPSRRLQQLQSAAAELQQARIDSKTQTRELRSKATSVLHAATGPTQQHTAQQQEEHQQKKHLKQHDSEHCTIPHNCTIPHSTLAPGVSRLAGSAAALSPPGSLTVLPAAAVAAVAPFDDADDNIAAGGDMVLLESDDGFDEAVIGDGAEDGLAASHCPAGTVAAAGQPSAEHPAVKAAVNSHQQLEQQRQVPPWLPQGSTRPRTRSMAANGPTHDQVKHGVGVRGTVCCDSGVDSGSGGSEDEGLVSDGSSSTWEDSEVNVGPNYSNDKDDCGQDESAEVDSDSQAGAAAVSSKGNRSTRQSRKAAVCKGRRAWESERKAAADGDESAFEGSDDDEAPAPAAATKRPRTKRAAGVGAANMPSAAAKPRTRKVAHRQNFRRHNSSATGFSRKFVSKSAAFAGRRPFRRVVNGKLIRGRRQAPHMAGQGAEYVEGFSGGVSGGSGGKGRCFKCGQAGHWEMDCPLKAAAIAAQEAELAAWKTAETEAEHQGLGGAGTAAAGAKDTAGTTLEPAAAGYPQHQSSAAQPAPPPPPSPLSHAQLCSVVGQNPSLPWQPDQLTDDQLRAVLKEVWGYEQFRGQQLPLIRAALQGNSMLGVLPTGLGKSLTYQLPALLLQGLVVVVSPLLALMRDQVSRLPPGLTGAMLQGGMLRQDVEQILDRAESGNLRLLYVAPEKLNAGPVLSCLRRMSPLPLVCVDEAHCMAEWGQGFRPAYFRLGHMLCNVLSPRAILALTATATPPTRTCVRQLLSIAPNNQVVESPLRDNLRLRVIHCNGATKGGGINAGVVQLLTTGELSNFGSIVVYCNTRAGADGLAAQLQRAAVSARPYHAGMQQPQRDSVQGAFSSGMLRVVVATIAFGMGIDKQDLDAVVHTALPQSLEEYVQQVGRAGRDGRTGHCILFLDDAEYLRLRALRHSGMVCASSIERFLEMVFDRDAESADSDDNQAPATAGSKRKACKKKKKLASSQHRCLPLQSTCTELDVPEEVLECCLSFLQADPVEPYLVALPNTAATLDVRFHKRTAEELAVHHLVIASILAAKTRKYSGTYKVHLDALLSAADRPPGEMLTELSDLAKAHEVGYDQGKQGSLVWRLERQPEDWRGLVHGLTTRLGQINRACVARLDRCYFALAGATIYSNQAAQERHLRAMAQEYFMDPQVQQQQQDSTLPATERAARSVCEDPAAAADLTGGEMVQEAMQSGEMPWGGSCPVLRPSLDYLLRQLRAALHGVSRQALDLGQAKFTSLTLARMLAGISSPAMPHGAWKGCHQFGTMTAVDFRLLAEAAEVVVAEFWDDEK